MSALEKFVPTCSVLLFVVACQPGEVPFDPPPPPPGQDAGLRPDVLLPDMSEPECRSNDDCNGGVCLEGACCGLC
jgi:hypothetical protein